MMSIVDELIQESPQFHTDLDGNPVSWSSNSKLLRLLESHIEPSMKTLETGAGWSTVIFASKGCQHTCIVPDIKQKTKITQYCDSKNISLNGVQFILEKSENVLPKLPGNDYMLYLIDGRHAFPFPFIDFFYGQRCMKNGGSLIIDDTDLISCHILKMFLSSDVNWQLTAEIEKFALYKKLGDLNYIGDWINQPFSTKKIKHIDITPE